MSKCLTTSIIKQIVKDVDVPVGWYGLVVYSTSGVDNTQKGSGSATLQAGTYSIEIKLFCCQSNYWSSYNVVAGSTTIASWSAKYDGAKTYTGSFMLTEPTTVTASIKVYSRWTENNKTNMNYCKIKRTA